MKINSILDLFASSRGTPYGPPAGPTPPPSSGPGMLAPWWTGTSDQFLGQQDVLGKSPDEDDVRRVLHKVWENYRDGSSIGFAGNPEHFEWGTPSWYDSSPPPGSPNAPPQPDPNAPADTGMLSRGSGFGAAYRRYRDSKNQD